MKFKTLIAISIIPFILLGCNGEKDETVEIIEEEYKPTVSLSTEYVAESFLKCENLDSELQNSICHLGTASYNNIPMAVESEGILFHTFTESDEDGHLNVYVMKDNTEKVLVHTLENHGSRIIHPVINVLPDGTVSLHIGSVRDILDRIDGVIYKSNTPFELDFECYGCEDNLGEKESDIQVWNTSWGEHINYTYQKHEVLTIERNLWVRTIYGTYEIVDDEAKSISYYNGEHLFLAYENFVNDEGRIHLIKTNDGVNWTNINDDELTLPLSESNDETLIYNSGKFVTLTDITFDDDLKILFVESDTENSDDGNISIKEWYNNNTLKITDTNHNQNSAAYFNGNIVTIQDGEAGIPGGDIVIYEKYVEKFRDDSTNCNYFRKAINSTEKSVVSCSPTSLNESSSHYIVNGDH